MNLEKQCLDASMPLRLTGRGVQHVFEQPLQIADGPVRRDAQLLVGLIEAIHPDGRIAERFRTGRVPAAKRRKGDVLLCEMQAIRAELIGTGIGLVGVIQVRADERIEQRGQAGMLGIRQQHRRAEVRDGDHANMRFA